MSIRHTSRARRTTAGLAVFTAASIAAAITGGPAAARVQETVTVTTEAKLVTYPPFPQSSENSALAFTPNPDDCQTFDFCDTIPLKVPIPDIGPGDDYTMILSLEWDDQGQSQPLEFHLYDNGQLKKQYEPGPQDPGYDARDSKYTRLRSVTDPKKHDIQVGQPELVDYNVVVVNMAGQNTGYGLYNVITTEEFTPPPEKLPPPPASSTGGGGGFGSTSQSSSSSFSDIQGQISVEAGESPSILGDVDAISDPDLLALQEENLEQALSAPTQLVTSPIDAGAPPEPPSGLTLFVWVVLVPGALLGGATTLLLRRRRLALAFG